MTTFIGPHEHYSLVSPQAFTERMEAHWTGKLGLVSSGALRALWGIMASTFVKSISNVTNNVEDAPWLILQPPTGSGKTQGACLFAAMQAEANALGTLKPVGVVIVTRLITQANQIASNINEHVGRTVAVAYHSENRAPAHELLKSDVLVITHQAYVNAADSLSAKHEAPWDRLTNWSGGRRLVTIIDEALANVVETNTVTLDNVNHTLAYVPQPLRLQYPSQVDVLLSLQEVLARHADPKERPDTNALRMLWDDQSPINVPDMSDLRAAMRLLPYDSIVLHEENEGSRNRLAKRVDETLKDSQAVLERWAFYAQSGKVHSINSASFLIPRDIPGPVVLDATANANFLWDLLGSKAQTVITPTNVRSYSEVTLHVARASGVGKHNMVQNAAARFPRLFA
ncbi:MAG: DEAD/DEAH box helicase family protein, partial [Solirubrobacteraceae bacterium]|nr:DEAD/DEAH box helicase family protein [Solirubrobacteraceae bacterium]